MSFWSEVKEGQDGALTFGFSPLRIISDPTRAVLAEQPRQKRIGEKELTTPRTRWCIKEPCSEWEQLLRWMWSEGRFRFLKMRDFRELLAESDPGQNQNLMMLETVGGLVGATSSCRWERMGSRTQWWAGLRLLHRQCAMLETKAAELLATDTSRGRQGDGIVEVWGKRQVKGTGKYSRIARWLEGLTWNWWLGQHEWAAASEWAVSREWTGTSQTEVSKEGDTCTSRGWREERGRDRSLQRGCTGGNALGERGRIQVKKKQENLSGAWVPPGESGHLEGLQFFAIHEATSSSISYRNGRRRNWGCNSQLQFITCTACHMFKFDITGA